MGGGGGGGSEALAVGLDYFVPSRKGQFEIFIDVLKQTTSDEVKTSSQFLLDQLLDYFSSVGTLYRLLRVPPTHPIPPHILLLLLLLLLLLPRM